MSFSQLIDLTQTGVGAVLSLNLVGHHRVLIQLLRCSFTTAAQLRPLVVH